MKKIIFLCLTAILLTSCSTYEPPQNQNQIFTAELTSDQQDLLRLLSAGNQAIHIFNYNIAEPFSEIKLWIDIYEYGYLTKTPNAIGVGRINDTTPDGQIAVRIDHDTNNQEFQFTLISAIEGSIASGQGERVAIQSEQNFASASISMQRAVEIQHGEDIILHMTKFFENSVFTSGDLQAYVQRPELLAIYPRVHAAKVRFYR